MPTCDVDTPYKSSEGKRQFAVTALDLRRAAG